MFYYFLLLCYNGLENITPRRFPHDNWHFHRNGKGSIVLPCTSHKQNASWAVHSLPNSAWQAPSLPHLPTVSWSNLRFRSMPNSHHAVPSRRHLQPWCCWCANGKHVASFHRLRGQCRSLRNGHKPNRQRAPRQVPLLRRRCHPHRQQTFANCAKHSTLPNGALCLRRQVRCRQHPKARLVHAIQCANLRHGVGSNCHRVQGQQRALPNGQVHFRQPFWWRRRVRGKLSKGNARLLPICFETCRRPQLALTHKILAQFLPKLAFFSKKHTTKTLCFVVLVDKQLLLVVK